MTQRRLLIINVGALVVTLPLFVSAFNKLIRHEALVTTLTKMGYGNFIHLIGFLELITAICFVVPLTRSIGFFLINAYLGGALAAELASAPKQALVPLFMLSLAWVLMFYDDAPWMLRGLGRAKNG